jgi:hypothetical protein
MTLLLIDHRSKFFKVRDIFCDAVRAFPNMRQKVLTAISDTREIALYLRGRCQTDSVEYLTILDEIERDCRITVSRLNRVDRKLELCKQKFDQATAFFDAEEDQSRSEQWLEQCINQFIDWHKQHTDLRNALIDFEGKWFSKENELFAKGV